MTSLLKLSEFYQPLNLSTLSISLLLFVFFDALGTMGKGFIFKSKNGDTSRILNWLVGFGLFIFVWFMLRFFIPPRQNSVLLSIAILFLISLPAYFKNRELRKLFSAIWQLKIPLLVISPFLSAVFVKASLPPYYADEMAYQFIPPYFRDLIDIWRFDGGLYSNVPQLFNTFFNLVFALTKTYSIVRLYHFLILVTAVSYAYLKLKLHFGRLVAFLFVFTFFSLPIDLVLISTLGYVDVATFSFILIGIINMIDFLFSKKIEIFFLSVVFWAMALGTKYTAVTIFVTSTTVFLTAIFFKYKSIFPKLTLPKILHKCVILFVLFGGYWYLKNLFAYGNPIYPFLLPCLRYAQYCQTQAVNFFAWTTPITLRNIPGIVKELLPANFPLQVALFVSPILAFFNRNPKTKIFSLILTLTIVLEFILLKQFSGFYPRYQQHLQLLMLLLITIQVSNRYRSAFLRLISGTFYLLVFGYVLASFVSTVIYTNSLKFVNWTEINYARGKISVYGWVDQRFPKVRAGIDWCENPPGGKPLALARYDPDMIWYEYDGFMRSFMTNCYFENPPLDGLPVENVLSVAKEKKLRFWTITPNRCLPQAEVKKHLDYEGEHQLYLRQLNNVIVCHSQEVKPNLYYFDYATL